MEVKTMSNKSKSWIKAAAVRAIKTVAQTAIATIGTAAVIGDVNWVMVAGKFRVRGGGQRNTKNLRKRKKV